MTAPIVVTVKRYRCPFCTHSRASRTASVDHIGHCWHNPDTRACTTCSNYVPAGDGDQCVPGQNCNCNVYPPECEAGVPLPEGPSFPVRGCPSWRLRKDDE